VPAQANSSVRQRIEAKLADRDFVSDQQRAVIEHSGNFFLLACPGSGKTRTAGVRVAWKAVTEPTARIAVASYTNVAVEQITGVATHELGVVLGPEHFLGTLHNFLLRYVYYPFGHLVMSCQGAPVVIGKDWDWPKVRLGDARIWMPVDGFCFDQDGALVARYDVPRGRTPETAVEHGGAQAERIKAGLARRGIASMSDALHYARLVLSQYADIAAHVARRFTELIVDEAQDTSDVQLRCVELIHQTGELQSLLLIGDLEQSIYGFQGAAPAKCAALAQSAGLVRLPLTQNFRSSQSICNVTCRFAGRAEPDEAVGANKDLGIAPEVLLYERDRPVHAAELFRERLEHHGIGLGEAVVLARRHELRHEINGFLPVACQPAVTTLAEAAALLRRGRTLHREAITEIDRLLARFAWNVPHGQLDHESRWLVREASMVLLDLLPPLDTNLGDWIAGARQATKDVVAALANPPAVQPSGHLKAASTHAQVSAVACFAPPRVPLEGLTVHAVKGESHGAVLLVGEARTRGQTQGELWSNRLRGDQSSQEDDEELRIAYVALSRAEKYCAVALPSDHTTVLADYLRAGFVDVTNQRGE
jgi:hypothetical protein